MLGTNHFFFFQAEDGIRDRDVTGVQTCALPIYMIRNLVGALVHIGKGAAPVTAMGDWRSQRNRTLAPPTFMPDGLYLTRVDYDAVWQLPSTTGQGLSGDPLQIFNF